MIELPEAVAIATQLSKTIKGKRVVEGNTGNSLHKWVFYKPSPNKLEKLLVLLYLNDLMRLRRERRISLEKLFGF